MSKKNYFITGLLSIIPLAITYFIITKLFSMFSKPGQGIIKNTIPDAHTDFIFPVIAEEFGAIVCVIIILLSLSENLTHTFTH